jgi:hypothetical protein
MQLETRVKGYFETIFTVGNIAGEVASLSARPLNWECPYGFVWFLKLFLTIQQRPNYLQYGTTLLPLLKVIAERLNIWIQHDYVDEDQWPYRKGWHDNSAFAMKMILEVLQQLDIASLGDISIQLEKLKASVVTTAKRLFQGDQQLIDIEETCPFLSPTLCEANLMTCCLGSTEEADNWLQKAICHQVWNMTPNVEGNPEDGYQSHLCGLNFSRAYDLACIAERLPKTHALRAKLLQSSIDHYNQSVSSLATGHFMGDHWLASFAVRAKLLLETLLHED